MDLVSFTFLIIIPLEIAILWYMYRHVFASINQRHWVKKAKEEGFLVDIFGDFIDVICHDVSNSVMERLKNEVLASQGTMTRQNSNPETKEEFGLAMAQKVLNDMGFKNINPIMALRVANGLKSMIKPSSNGNESDFSDNLLKSPIL